MEQKLLLDDSNLGMQDEKSCYNKIYVLNKRLQSMERDVLIFVLLVGPAPAYDTQPAAGHAYYPPVGYQNVNSYAPVYTHQPVMSTTMVEFFRTLGLLLYIIYM